MKTISDHIFELLREQKMSQKEFAKRTGIAEEETDESGSRQDSDHQTFSRFATRSHRQKMLIKAVLSSILLIGKQATSCWCG